MKTKDLFTTTSKKLNESLNKFFGKKINLENFDLEQLQDARNKLRTQLFQIRGKSEFNENLENDAYHQAQWMLDAINAEIAERDEHIIEADVEEDEIDPDGRIQAEIEKFLATNPKDGDDLSKFHDKAIMDKNKELDDYLTSLYGYVADQTGAGGTEEAGVYDEMLDMLHQMMADKGWSEDVEEGRMSEIDIDLRALANRGDEEDLIAALDGEMGPEVADVLQNMMDDLKDELAAKGMNDVMRDQDKMIEILWDKIVDEYSGDDDDDGQPSSYDEYQDLHGGDDWDHGQYDESYGKYKDLDDETGDRLADWMQEWADFATSDDDHGLASNIIGMIDDLTDGKIGFRDVQEYVFRVADEPTSPLRKDFIKNFAPNKIKKTQPDLFDNIQAESRVDEKAVSKAQQRAAGIALAAKRKGKTPPGKGAAAEMAKMSTKELEKYAGTKHKGLPAKKDESVTQGEDMTTLREGEVQQASAIVTAKTMVDRVGRWIEELSGMENETLLQLGDSIRDEMGQEQSRAFIEQVAPAIQQALETLKGTRETISNGVNTLATGEQPADMLGAEPAAGGEEMPAAEPDAMNMPAEEPAADEFAAAEPAAGGPEEAGREQRESINYQNRLLKVLAG